MTIKKIFLDKNLNNSEESKAYWLVVHHYDSKGKLENEEWFSRKHK